MLPDSIGLLKQFICQDVRHGVLQRSHLRHALRAQDMARSSSPALEERVIRQEHDVLVPRIDDMLQRDRAVGPARILRTPSLEKLADVCWVEDDDQVLGSHLQANYIDIGLLTTRGTSRRIAQAWSGADFPVQGPSVGLVDSCQDGKFWEWIGLWRLAQRGCQIWRRRRERPAARNTWWLIFAIPVNFLYVVWKGRNLRRTRQLRRWEHPRSIERLGAQIPPHSTHPWMRISATHHSNDTECRGLSRPGSRLVGLTYASVNQTTRHGLRVAPLSLISPCL